MAMHVNEVKDEAKPERAKDPILEVRRIVKRAALLDKPEQRYLIECLKKLVGEEG